VFLSTVHSVKGLEFDHVFILDGGWSKKKGDDAEEERRLFYVAMSRARETLSLFSINNAVNPHSSLLAGEFMLTRSLDVSGATPGSIYTYVLLGMDDLFIDFAGMRKEDHPSRKAINDLGVGEVVSFKPTENTIELVNAAGISVARLSKFARNSWSKLLQEVEEVKVVAIVRRYKEDNSDGAQKERFFGDRWEVPLVEVKKRPLKRYNPPPAIPKKIKSTDGFPIKKNKQEKKVSLSQKQNKNAANGKPKNAGLPWTDKAKENLSHQFAKNISIQSLAEMFQRTEKAIVAELIRQGLVEEQDVSFYLD